MALPGVQPTSQLLSLLAESDKPNVGGVLGLNVGDEAAYKASLAGQRAPIYGKGGFQGFGALEPYGQVFQLADAEGVIKPDVKTDASEKSPFKVDQGDKGIPSENIPTGEGINLSDLPIVGGLFDGKSGESTAKGQLSSQLPFDFGDVNIPGIGEVNITDAGTNLALDQVVGTAIDPIFGGLGLVSAIVNPTMEETSWGTPYNTGGGGLIGVLGQLSLNDLENVYAETEKGTEGYEFYAPGTIEGVDTPIGVKPGIFGFGEVLTGATNLLDQEQYDKNSDGIITVQEFKVGSGQQEEQDYSDYLFTDLGNSIQEAGGQFVDDFTSGMSEIGTGISTGLESVGTGISNVVSDIGSGVSDFFSDVGDFFSGGSDDSSSSSPSDDNDSGGGSSGGGGGPCFLTTAIVERRGEADDGPTLTKLRNFRDTYMATMPEVVEEYYIVAPKIVASIPKDHSDWNWVGEQIDISVSHIDKGDLDSAFKTYKGMVERLKHEWL